MSNLRLVPCDRAQANAFLVAHHRHHGRVVGGKLFLAAAVEGTSSLDILRDRFIVGVAVVGRPVARRLDDGLTLEVTRLCTNGYRNACSFLYGAAWRAVRAIGYAKLITYTLPEEGGSSLRAAGWRVVGESKGGTWSREGRPRVDLHPLQAKLRWEAPEVAT